MTTSGFRLPETCVVILRRDLKTFHGLFDRNKCTGGFLEELIYRALQIYYGDNVVWRIGSHSWKADITLTIDDEPLCLSIKSGSWTKNYLKISGYRLTRYKDDLDALNQFLVNNNHAMMLAVPAEKVDSRWQYKLVYLAPSTFQYPALPDDWAIITGKTARTRGQMMGWEYISPNGMRMTIKKNMSYQLWWEIPRALIDDLVVIDT